MKTLRSKHFASSWTNEAKWKNDARDQKYKTWLAKLKKGEWDEIVADPPEEPLPNAKSQWVLYHADAYKKLVKQKGTKKKKRGRPETSDDESAEEGDEQQGAKKHKHSATTSRASSSTRSAIPSRSASTSRSAITSRSVSSSRAIHNAFVTARNLQEVMLQEIDALTMDVALLHMEGLRLPEKLKDRKVKAVMTADEELLAGFCEVSLKDIIKIKEAVKARKASATATGEFFRL